MTTSFNGTTGITFPDASTQSNSQVGMKNRIIDGGFTINQRVYVSNTSLSSGTYAHDRWKGGAGGGTYTFTQGALGVNTTITITAGTLVQVIEGCNLPEGGTYVLSWTGTAQGRLNGGTYGSSGTVTVTGWVAGTNLNVEFSTGTLGSVQLEKGSTATSFDVRPYGTEFALCQRYYVHYANDGTSSGGIAIGFQSSTTAPTFAVQYPQIMRAEPTVSFLSLSVSDHITYTAAVTAVSTILMGFSSGIIFLTIAASGVQYRPCSLLTTSGTTGFLALTSEL